MKKLHSGCSKTPPGEVVTKNEWDGRTPIIDPLSGSIVAGRYELIERIDRGGMAIIYAAKDTLGTDKVAVKIARRDVSVETANKALVRETVVLDRIRHENIIRLIDRGEHNGRQFLVLEHLEGVDLGERLTTEVRIPWKYCRDILLPICHALQAVHDAGIVHRDIKPGNMFLTTTLVKLIDFGLARLSEEEERRIPGIVAGTLHYLAPEMIREERYDHRIDIYALGITMYEMLSGVWPFDGDYMDIMLGHKNVIPALPSRMRPYLGIPAELDAIVMRALEKDPKRRFMTASEMGEMIESVTGWPREEEVEGMTWEAIEKKHAS